MSEPLPGRFQTSFKLALSITMSYGLALWFEWDHPHWAAFAVALISTSTLNESLAKGGQRLLGTLLAVPVSLTLIALFSQDRWLFMLSLATWLAFCAYRMSSGRNAYGWFCAGFITAIIAANGGPDAVNAFRIAVNRTLETSLGIVCFSIVFALLWPDQAPAEPPPKADNATSKPQPPAIVSVFPDTDRIQQAARVFITYCCGFMLLVYVPDFPGGFGFLGMFAAFTILLSNSPQMAPSAFFVPAFLTITLTAPIYMMVMPLLSGFMQLGPLIFIVAFVICYTFHQSSQGMARTIGLTFFAVVSGISNEQTYSFISVVTTAQMFGLLLLILTITASLPVSNQPEKVCRRLIERFLRSASYLSGTQGHGPIDRYLEKFHRYELDTVPTKMKTWRARIPEDPDILLLAEMEKLDAIIEQMSDIPHANSEDATRRISVILDKLTEQYADMDIPTLTQARF